jgi:hypothetical protein
VAIEFLTPIVSRSHAVHSREMIATTFVRLLRPGMRRSLTVISPARRACRKAFLTTVRQTPGERGDHGDIKGADACR